LHSLIVELSDDIEDMELRRSIRNCRQVPEGEPEGMVRQVLGKEALYKDGLTIGNIKMGKYGRLTAGISVSPSF